MKNEIKNVEKSKTIKSTKILKVNSKKGKNGAIFVNYLDGTQDVFELNSENLEKISEIANEQAQKFVGSKDARIRKIKKVLVGASIGATVLGLAATIGIAESFGGNLAYVIGTSVIALADTAVIAKGINQINNIKKYDLYVNNIKDKIDEYKQILAKEMKLVHSRRKEKEYEKAKIISRNALGVDRISLADLNKIGEKVDRYNEVVDQVGQTQEQLQEQPKIKTIQKPSLY